MEKTLFDQFYYDDEAVITNDYQQCVNEEGEAFLIKWLDVDPLLYPYLDGQMHIVANTNNKEILKCVKFGLCRDNGKYAIVYPLIQIQPLSCSSVQECLGVLLKVARFITSANFPHGNLCPSTISYDHESGELIILEYGFSDIIEPDPNYTCPEGDRKKKMADIYSLGRIICWLATSIDSMPEELIQLGERMSSKARLERGSISDAIKVLEQLNKNKSGAYVQVMICSEIPITIDTLNTDTVSFFVGKSFLIFTEQFTIEARYSNQVIILERLCSDKQLQSLRKYASLFPSGIQFCSDKGNTDLDDVFNEFRANAKSQSEQRQFSRDELNLYSEVIEQELQYIDKNALSCSYESCKRIGRDIIMTVQIPQDKMSAVTSHVEYSNEDPSLRYDYIVNHGKKEIKFSGKPFGELKYSGEGYYYLQIKDCSGAFRDLPNKGKLNEDTILLKTEQNRKKAALAQVREMRVKNPALIRYLFSPEELRPIHIPESEYSFTPAQKDKAGNAYSYEGNQLDAIVRAVNNKPLSIIQGPPGTGKTTVITEIVFQLIKKNPQCKILLTSQTNSAVDQVLDKIVANKIPALRLASDESRIEFENVQGASLQNKFSTWQNDVRDSVSKLLESSKGNQSLAEFYERWRVSVASFKQDGPVARQYLKNVKVIGATCSHIAASKYADFSFSFDYVIMDESGKATTAEALVPINMAQNLILVGDHRQLRPMISSTPDVIEWLKKQKNTVEYENCVDDYYTPDSLFQQVIGKIDSSYSTQLTECRRMSQRQTELTSKCFYESEGDKPLQFVSRSTDNEHHFQKIDSSVLFVDIGEHYTSKTERRSSYNTESIKAILKVLKWLNDDPVSKDYTYGVITAYKAQHKHLWSEINKLKLNGQLSNICRPDTPLDKFCVSIFDKFQGMERDVMIVDLVKSGPGLNMGFMEVPNRINVALSRQKKLLIIVGDYKNWRAARPRRSGKRTALQRYLDSIEDCIIPVPECDNNQDNATPKVGVVEFSTKAVKCQFLKAGAMPPYSISSFDRSNTEKTLTRDCMSNGVMDLEKYKENVLSHAVRFVNTMRESGVTEIHAIATAVYRQISNIEEVKGLIKESCNVELDVISPEKEAEYLLEGFMNFRHPESIAPSDNILLIDQGGGGTIIAAFQDGRMLWSKELRLGTLELKEVFFKDENQSIDQALASVNKYVLDVLNKEGDNHFSDCKIIVHGSAIKEIPSLLGMKNNSKDIQGLTISLEQLEEGISICENNIRAKEDLMEIQSLIKNTSQENKNFENKFSVAIGSKVFLYILRAFNSRQMTLCGAGPWAGLFFHFNK